MSAPKSRNLNRCQPFQPTHASVCKKKQQTIPIPTPADLDSKSLHHVDDRGKPALRAYTTKRLLTAKSLNEMKRGEVWQKATTMTTVL